MHCIKGKCISDMEDLIQFIGHFSAISNAIVQKDKHYFIDHQDIYASIYLYIWKRMTQKAE